MKVFYIVNVLFFACVEIKSFFKPMRTIGDKLRNGKDPVHPFERQDTVYCVPCGDCDQKYLRNKKVIQNLQNIRKPATHSPEAGRQLWWVWSAC